jgi:hypothetical protein
MTSAPVDSEGRDVAEIARGLTKAQQAAIFCSFGEGLWRDGRFDFVGHRRAAQELYGSLVEPSKPNGLWATYRLTPLGLAVREYLLANDKGEG